MSLIVLSISISKSKTLASLPSKKIASACLSSTSVTLSPPPVFQLLRENAKFWAQRSSFSMPRAEAEADADTRPPRHYFEEIDETSIRQRHLARQDLFKNAHLKGFFSV